MSFTDFVGFTGVSILLMAFFLNLSGKFHHNGLGYISLNLVGAGIACFASILLHYIPFIILEGAWSLVSLIALIKVFKRSGTENEQK